MKAVNARGGRVHKPNLGRFECSGRVAQCVARSNDRRGDSLTRRSRHVEALDTVRRRWVQVQDPRRPAGQAASDTPVPTSEGQDPLMDQGNEVGIDDNGSGRDLQRCGHHEYTSFPEVPRR